MVHVNKLYSSKISKSPLLYRAFLYSLIGFNLISNSVANNEIPELKSMTNVEILFIINALVYIIRSFAI